MYCIMSAEKFHIWILAAILCGGVIISGYGVSGVPIDFDPIAVAQPNDAQNNPDSNDSAPEQYTLPNWLADLNDPDVGPGVPYVPQDDTNLPKVISWDLLPPQHNDAESSTSLLGTGQSKKLHVTLSPGQSYSLNSDDPAISSRTTSTTIRSTTPKWITYTTKTPTTIRTTTARTTTTTTTTTPRPTTTTTTTTTLAPSTTTKSPISAFRGTSDVIYALPGGNAQFLPSWLEGYDDPELNIALPFEVPEDNNEYNHTLSLDLLPPLEPYEDLKVLSVSGLKENPTPAGPFASITTIPSTAITIPTTIHTTTIRPHPSTPTPSQFQSISKQTISPSTPTTQQPSLFTAPTATTTTTTTTTIAPSTSTESAISNRISQITLKSAAQPSGFKSNIFLASQPTVAVPVNPTFQPLPLLDLKNNPFFASKFGQTGFASVSTTTTSTTTKTPTTSTVKEFLFGSATIPPWLSDVKDPALGPGIPFTLAGGGDAHLPHNDIQAPLKQVDEQPIDGVTIQKSISSELSPTSFPHNTVLSQSAPTTQPFTATTLQESSNLFTSPIVVPPNDVDNNANSEFQTNSISITNFPAVTEPSTKTTPKITFNKSDQGKVISNTVFAQPPTKPFFGQDQPAVPSGFTSAPIAPEAFAKPTVASAVLTGKYTGGFGGAPGILGGQNKPGYAIQPDGSIIDPDYTVRPVKVTAAPVPILVTEPLAAALPTSPSVPKATAANIPKRAYTGTFGGPPGILSAFDNAKFGQ